MDKSNIGLAGEYYVLAQLTHRGFVASLTLGNAKKVDILVANQDLETLYKVEVKTTVNKKSIENLFGSEPQYMWVMSEKHELISDPKLFYCFVCLESTETMPKIFVVPSADVAQYVKWQHEHWLSTRLNPVKATTSRKFRIATSDPRGYLNNWAVFEK